MIEMIPFGSKTVLEPTPGEGNIVSLLTGYDVTAPDDWFLLPSQRYDCVIMNPPFSSKYAFLQNAPSHFAENGMKLGYHILTECMKRSDNVIALMPWNTVSDSDLRLRFLKEYGIRSLTTLPRKTFNYVRLQTVILELQSGYKGDTVFNTFNY